MRKFTPNRWNWSQKAEKWVYVRIGEDGKRHYAYSKVPPPQYLKLVKEINRINDIILNSESQEERENLFLQITSLGKQLQSMSIS